ncbi:MAG: class I SAM-dependent methyltransferase [Elusimicrobia bacterium]|nr:class I SAM-dependent methyltransferase [Elusimicrobiota bacterium]
MSEGVERRGTEKEFGFEWQAYSEILPEHREQFWTWVQPLKPENFKRVHFLDAGCGMGRNSYWAMQAGAASGYAFDFDSRTVSAASNNLRSFPSCRVAFQSIYDLDRSDEFDIVFCIGVLHHLANPRGAVAKLVRAAKPGGMIAVWVYGKEGNSVYLAFLRPLRFLTKHLPLGFTRILAKGITAVYRGGLRILPVTSYRTLQRRLSFRHTEAIIFDQLFPSIANYWTRGEALALFDGLPVSFRSMVQTHGHSWSLIFEKSPAKPNTD